LPIYRLYQAGTVESLAALSQSHLPHLKEKIMFARSRLMFLLVVASCLSSAGCIVIGLGRSCWVCRGPWVWTEATTEQIQLDTTDLKALEVRTHNGAISFDGQGAGNGAAHVTVTKKAGGRSHADAERALEAVEVYLRPAGGGVHRLGWRWKGVRQPDWGAEVAFAITAPGNLRLAVETHNGGIGVKGLVGDARLITHNGQITVESAEGTLDARTHNGAVTAAYVGRDVTLRSHNGPIVADLDRCETLNGDISTHNGDVEIVVSEGTSGTLSCATHRGTIQCDVPVDELKASRSKLTGRIGSGEGKLDVATHNGGIKITKASG
jgi:hypothetical protein